MSQAASQARPKAPARVFYPEDIGSLAEEEKIALRRDVTRRFRGGGTPYLTSLIRSSDAVRK